MISEAKMRLEEEPDWRVLDLWDVLGATAQKKGCKHFKFENLIFVFVHHNVLKKI